MKKEGNLFENSKIELWIDRKLIYEEDREYVCSKTNKKATGMAGYGIRGYYSLLYGNI